MKTKPTIFLSSTCHDLEDARNAVVAFVASVGYDILDSRTRAFPVDPKLHSYGACIQNVARSDLVVLVVKGRYGGITPGAGVSITTEEYRAAIANDIPVFTFVQHEVWELLQEWKKNKNGDFSACVESNRVFELIDEVRKNTHNNWIWPFAACDEITDTLRKQWAALYAQLLVGARGGNFFWQSGDDDAAINHLPPRLNIASHWTSKWGFVKNGQQVSISDSIELHQHGLYVYGTAKSTEVTGPATFANYSYTIEGKISSDGVLEGRWQNTDPGRSYRGQFQLRLSMNGRSLKGVWIGADQQGFHSGEWCWNAT